jgi:hypothetical protein
MPGLAVAVHDHVQIGLAIAGRHERFVIDEARFLSKLDQKRAARS